MRNRGIVALGLLFTSTSALAGMPSPTGGKGGAGAAAAGHGVSLPSSAEGEVRLDGGAFSGGFRLLGATRARAEMAGDELVYRGGLKHEGASHDVHLRTIEGGVEDFVMFSKRPADERVRYEVDVSGAAGLRLVAGSLEWLDAGGAPRLRVRAPYVLDATGARRLAVLSVVGCAYDESPLPPWGRAVTAPGASRCVLEVTWGSLVGQPISYPAALDPAWVDGGKMVVPRNGHAATRLADGRVLVAGGWNAVNSNTYINAAELFDPATKTWAATTSMKRPRGHFGLTTLASGKVLAAAGDDQLLATAETFDPATATWTATDAMKVARDGGSSTLLGDGRVLVAGGCSAYSSTCDKLEATSETYDPATDAWTLSLNSMSVPREAYVMVTLGDGSALAAGGCPMYGANFGCFTSTKSVDRYDQATNKWSPTGQLVAPQDHDTTTRLANGKVLLAGGLSNGNIVKTAQLFDPAVGTWSVVMDTNSEHDISAISPLADGRAILSGSWGTLASLAQITGVTELFDPATGAWSPGPPLLEPRGFHTSTVLADGRVLIAGGFKQGPAMTLAECGTGEIYDPNAVFDPKAVCPAIPNLTGTCAECAASKCCAELTACKNNPDCAALYACVDQCGTTMGSFDCLTTCASSCSPNGYSDFKLAMFCVTQNTCPAECSTSTGTGVSTCTGAAGAGGAGGSGSAGQAGAGGVAGGAGAAGKAAGGAAGAGTGGASAGAGGTGVAGGSGNAGSGNAGAAGVGGGAGGSTAGGAGAAGATTGGSAGASAGNGGSGPATGGTGQGTGGSSAGAGGAKSTGGSGGTSTSVGGSGVAGTSSSTGGAGATGGAATGGNAGGAAAPADSTDDGGCGCRVASPRPGPAWAVVGLGLMIAARRRRRSER